MSDSPVARPESPAGYSRSALDSLPDEAHQYMQFLPDEITPWVALHDGFHRSGIAPYFERSAVVMLLLIAVVAYAFRVSMGAKRWLPRLAFE